MKKICIVTTVSLTIRAFLIPVLRYYKENTDWDVTVICSDDPDLQALLPEGVRYIPVSMKRGIDFSAFGTIRQMAKIFRKERFDIVQYSTPNASLYASVAAKLSGIPVRLYCQWGMAYVGFSGLKRFIFKQIEKTVCSLSTWIEPDSHGNLYFAHSEGLYPERKGSVIWNGSACGVNLQKFDISHKEEWRTACRDSFGIPHDAFVYGFIGRITGDKGVNELFSAFKSILSKYPDAYLMMVGENDKPDSVDEELYRWATEEPHVIFCGYTNVVEQFLSAMDVYVLPSYREGFGMSVVESEAMGVPVIVTDIPGPTNAMLRDETGLVVPKKDIDALWEAMQKLLCDPSLCKTLGANGYAFAAEKFEQNKLLEHILKDRERLLGL